MSFPCCKMPVFWAPECFRERSDYCLRLSCSRRKWNSHAESGRATVRSRNNLNNCLDQKIMCCKTAWTTGEAFALTHLNTFVSKRYAYIEVRRSRYNTQPSTPQPKEYLHLSYIKDFSIPYDSTSSFHSKLHQHGFLPLWKIH